MTTAETSTSTQTIVRHLVKSEKSIVEWQKKDIKNKKLLKPTRNRN
jgi:hypothetical protein